MSREPISYRNERGNLIFVYCPESANYTCWYIGEKIRTKEGFSVKKIIDRNLKTYRTEKEARAHLHAYAGARGYEPAY